MPEITNVIPNAIIESDWGNDIRDRTVQRYADAAERTSLHGSPTDGDLAFLEDTGVTYVYHSAAWNALGGGIADITGSPLDELSDVTAHTPAKGHLLVADGDSWEVLAVGANDEILTADSVEATGLKWAAGGGGGGAGLTYAYKAVDEVLSASQQTLQNDDDLFFSVGASEVWAFEIVLQVNNSTAGDDIGWLYTFPAGATGFHGVVTDWSGTSTFSASAARALNSEEEVDLPFASHMITARGVIINSTTAGTLQLQWRNKSAARNITVKAGSHMIAHQLA